jgi:hypothetical protein
LHASPHAARHGAALLAAAPQVMGTYECSVKLHPEVNGTFSVVIQKEKNATAKKK